LLQLIFAIPVFPCFICVCARVCVCMGICVSAASDVTIEKLNDWGWFAGGCGVVGGGGAGWLGDNKAATHRKTVR